MNPGVAAWMARVIELYLAAGLVFAVAFALKGAATLDSGVKDAGSGFRLLILPGAALLWPFLWVRWVRR